jgi:hypothetical protein
MSKEKCSKCHKELKEVVIRVGGDPLCGNCSKGAYTWSDSPYNNFKRRKTKG